jgi:hypothetical protein
MKPRSHISYSWECRRVWKNEPSHSQGSQFDSWPLKVENHLDFLSSRWRANTDGKLLIRLQLCFKTHLNRRFARKVMRPQNCENPNCGNFGTFTWESQDKMTFGRQNDIWVLVPCPGTKYIIRGKVVASPKFGLWWVLWVRICPWLIRVPKVFQLCTNQLVVWFV